MKKSHISILKNNVKWEVTKKGVTLWVKEVGKDGSFMWHWVLDASCFREDGEIRLGRRLYTHELVYKKGENSLQLMKVKP